MAGQHHTYFNSVDWDARLVRRDSRGTRRVYSVELEGLKELRSYLEGFWADVLDAFHETGRPQEKIDAEPLALVKGTGPVVPPGEGLLVGMRLPEHD